MNADFVSGSIVTGKSGTPLTVAKVDGDILLIPTESGHRQIHKSAILEAIHPDPRLAVSKENGRIEVDLNRLSLDYVSPVGIPHWEPKIQLKPYEELTKLYFDIETAGLEPETDRIYMVGIMNESGEKAIFTDPNEVLVLKQTIDYLTANKPQLLIGHNLFHFDLPFIMARCELYDISHPFGLGNKPTTITSSSWNGKPIEYIPVYWQGVDIIDTLQQAAIWDKQAAKLTGYGLKACAIALGLRDDRRLELSNEEIQNCWHGGDLTTLQTYLEFDLEDTALLADFLVPNAYYQMRYVPSYLKSDSEKSKAAKRIRERNDRPIDFQYLAVASPALKAEKVHKRLIGGDPIADERQEYTGATIEMLAPGLHSNVAKIDVASLYPSIMLRYGVCSRKDPQHRFLGWMQAAKNERIALKELAKTGDTQADFRQTSNKILLNGSYGFFGTGFYSFNDYEAAALVTAYGRKILDLMLKTVIGCGATPIEIDTDGIFFSSTEPEKVYQAVLAVLPSGIDIDLELSGCGMYVPKAKNYVIVMPNGKIKPKGIFRKRDRTLLEREFPIEYLRLYFMESPLAAEDYYQQVRQSIEDRTIAIEKLQITKKISKEPTDAEGNIKLGKNGLRPCCKIIEQLLNQKEPREYQRGDKPTYWIAEKVKYASTKKDGSQGRQLKSKDVATQSDPYWVDYYLKKLDAIHTGIHQNSLSECDPVELTMHGTNSKSLSNRWKQLEYHCV